MPSRNGGSSWKVIAASVRMPSSVSAVPDRYRQHVKAGFGLWLDYRQKLEHFTPGGVPPGRQRGAGGQRRLRLDLQPRAALLPRCQRRPIVH